MPCLKFVILGRTFNSQRHLISEIQTILNHYNCGEDIDRDDFKFMMEILKRHPKAKQKIGPGIQRIFKDEGRVRGFSFWFERTDGTTEDFNYYRCISRSSEAPPEERPKTQWGI